MKELDLPKFIALNDEFRTANKLIRLGLGELQNINLDNDFYFLPLQLLSQGFERFMKAYVCTAHFTKEGTLPNSKYLSITLGHDLLKLLNEIRSQYFIIYSGPSQFSLDWNLINKSEDLKELLNILSEFGKYARYYNFDLITDNKRDTADPKVTWQNFEHKINPFTTETLETLMNPDIGHEVFQKTTKKIICIFEEFIACLSRQIIRGTLGQLGKQLTADSFFDYGMLYEGDFGKTDYRKITIKYNERNKAVHKRTIIDRFNRKFNSSFKSKRIKKKNYKGDWPFYADEVIIECRYKHWCIITINGYDYALNGVAKGRYKLEDPHEAGMAILGKSINDFIKRALRL